MLYLHLKKTHLYSIFRTVFPPGPHMWLQTGGSRVKQQHRSVTMARFLPWPQLELQVKCKGQSPHTFLLTSQIDRKNRSKIPSSTHTQLYTQFFFFYFMYLHLTDIHIWNNVCKKKHTVFMIIYLCKYSIKNQCDYL